MHKGEVRHVRAKGIDTVEQVRLIARAVTNEGGDSLYLMDQLADTSGGDEAWLENIVLREAMKVLSERERKIINLRFYKNKTQMEIADEIGISQAQVSRLEKGALEKMRKQL